MKKTNGFAKKLVSSFITCAMTTTLVSAPALAYAADEMTSEQTDAQEETTEIDEATAESRIYDSIEIASVDADSSDDPSNASVKESSGEVDIVSVKVDLAQDTKSAIAYNNMSFVVTDDENKEVALTGWTGIAPEGELQIPARVVSGSTEYTVTSIEKSAGGGSLI